MIFKTKGAIIVTKNGHYGITKHDTITPVLWIPAFAFLFLLGNAKKWDMQIKNKNRPFRTLSLQFSKWSF